ncbi:hypothetical protein B0H15DRAFT_844321 [Mycena belliarum]|uniref:Uncharacterized protein n=1 Tax=Mycena belliarum TaxID=1033014 RepID=A0AAD6XTL2_9AGAR|nr:hypothetical protein B0H15DRAFT_844321 [Mycena belliae]
MRHTATTSVIASTRPRPSPSARALAPRRRGARNSGALGYAPQAERQTTPDFIVSVNDLLCTALRGFGSQDTRVHPRRISAHWNELAQTRMFDGMLVGSGRTSVSRAPAEVSSLLPAPPMPSASTLPSRIRRQSSAPSAPCVYCTAACTPPRLAPSAARAEILVNTQVVARVRLAVPSRCGRRRPPSSPQTAAHRAHGRASGLAEARSSPYHQPAALSRRRTRRRIPLKPPAAESHQPPARSNDPCRASRARNHRSRPFACARQSSARAAAPIDPHIQAPPQTSRCTQAQSRAGRRRIPPTAPAHARRLWWCRTPRAGFWLSRSS